MRALSSVLLLVAASATSALGQVKAPPFPASGRYVGVISVTEKIPDVGLSAVPLETRPDPRTYVAAKSSARVSVVSDGSRFRIVGLPGTTLLSVLDEPTFAAVKLVPHFADGSDDFTYFTVDARKGSGNVEIHGNRVLMTFQLFSKQNDFSWGEIEVLGQTTVRLDLRRTGRD